MEYIYKAIFGPIELPINILVSPEYIVRTQKSLDLLTEDIKKNGLVNPIDVGIHLKEDKQSFIVERGNQRIFVLKKLGYERVLSYLTIYFYKDTLFLEKIIKNIFKPLKESFEIEPLWIEQKYTKYGEIFKTC